MNNQGEQDAHNNAGCQRKVKREVFPPDRDIAGKTPKFEVRKKLRVCQQEADNKQDRSQNNQNAAQSHTIMLFDPRAILKPAVGSPQ